MCDVAISMYIHLISGNIEQIHNVNRDYDSQTTDIFNG